MTDAGNDLATRRRRLLWRATHRGIKEMDVLLGRFAAVHVDSMSDEALDEFEAIVECPDQDLLAWIIGDAPVPAGQSSATLEALIAFRP